jgi:hydroxylamine reductase
MNEYEMYCNQCQEAYQGEACQTVGMCGKDPELSALQDLLVYTARGVAIYTREIRGFKTPCSRPNHYVLDALFATITNANFDKQAIVKKIQEGLELREHVRGALQKAGKPAPALQHHDAATWMAFDEQELLQKSRVVGLRHTLGENEDRRSLAELLTYGLKGLAAYAEHAMNLGYTSAPLMTFIDEALIAPLYEKNGVPELLDWVLQCGKHGVDGMKLLDEANTTEYGHPQITEVALGVGTNPGILVSGHDLQDLEQLLIQSQGKGVDIYTHSEMLPAHYYPKLKKFSHLVGNYGNAWWQQTAEFSTFNGPILFTTNCIVPPRPNAPYLDKLYSTGSSGHPGFVHINSDAAGKKDFSQIIAHAQKCAPPTAIEQGSLVGGFARNQIGLLATKVIQAVQSGAIKEFVVMAGCDGRQSGRNYYTDYAQSLQQDTVILTAGCAKYRYNKLDLGHIDGIPRVLDAGQCNDSYSLVSTALTLQDALQLESINDLPISYNIAWYEQKAVIVLLALLYLGVKNIQLGPTLPAFLSPGVGKVLVEQFGLHAPAQVA